MRQIHLVTAVIAGLAVSASAYGQLTYTFENDEEGFQNVAWSPAAPGDWSGTPTVQQTHTAGGWQMMMTKEFSWAPGGGNDNQQLEMQRLANLGTARISFDAMVDGASFPAGVQTWFQLNIVGNSAGTTGWTQTDNIFTVSGWHPADDAAFLTMHFDYPFSQLGWEPGDEWFQFWTGANSDAAVPVNFYLDNVIITPEPASGLIALAGLLLIRRRRPA
ncbi:MAG: hypothetical protein KA354_18670 [Phycisphaerae bacterium]|nr:hypothetical protein [Phycisphaerae bacterium]